MYSSFLQKCLKTLDKDIKIKSVHTNKLHIKM